MSDTRPTFHHQLEETRQKIVRLAAATTELIPRATAVLLDGDLEGAEYLIAADAEFDARALEVEEDCFRLIALQQPMAVDMRTIVAGMKMIADIERSADLAKNICKAARRIHGHPLDPRLRGLISRMGTQSHALFQEATEAFAEGDDAKAAALDDMDTMLDQTHRDFIQAIFESHAEGRTDIQVAVQLALVARFYERIGDHAVNVAERVRYIITGWLPEPTANKPEADVEVMTEGLT